MDPSKYIRPPLSALIICSLCAVACMLRDLHSQQLLPASVLMTSNVSIHVCAPFLSSCFCPHD
eukprot:26143-Pelagomonas_calceolata.AAC.1